MLFGRKRFAPLEDDTGDQFVRNALRLAERSHDDSINPNDSRELQRHLQKKFHQFSQQKEQNTSILAPQYTTNFSRNQRQ